MARWVRHGAPAGVSLLLGFLVGTLANIFTEGRSWPVGVGLVVLLATWIGLEMRLAAHSATRTAVTGPAQGAPAEVPAQQPPIVPQQLPPPTAHFVGREAQLATLNGLLAGSRASAREAVVITVISGTAGVGKSALAIWWAHGVADRFPDGQLYINLRGFHPGGKAIDPRTAVRGFLDALQVPSQAVPANLDAQTALYRSLLSGKRMLVVLDNAHDAEQVRPLLPGSPTCMVLITSRHRLSSLVTVESAHPMTLGLMTAREARSLLIQRLGAERIAAEPDTVDEIIEECARLPLALAIVAARAAAQPGFRLSVLAGQLRGVRDRLDVLSAGDAVSDARSVFSWSYLALSPAAAQMFRLLGLHPGPDISTAALASLAGRTVQQIQPLLDELATVSLVVEPTLGRYSLHDLLRVYASEQADAHEIDDERRTAVHRMLDHYLHTAYAAARLLEPSRAPLTLTPPASGVAPENPAGHQEAQHWFTIEYPVLMAVATHAANAGWDSHTWQLAWTLITFQYRQGYWEDQIATGAAAVAGAGRLGERAAQARAHRMIAHASIELGQYSNAETHLRQALNLAAEAGDRTGEAYTWHSLTYVWGSQGRYDKALEHAERALALFETIDDPVGQADALNSVGWYHALSGEYDQALSYCEQALGRYQELDDRHGKAATWDSLGYVHHHLDHQAQAITCYGHALLLFQELNDRPQQAATLNRLGEAYRASGDHAASQTAWQQALAILDDLYHPDAEQIRTRLVGPEVPEIQPP